MGSQNEALIKIRFSHGLGHHSLLYSPLNAFPLVSMRLGSGRAILRHPDSRGYETPQQHFSFIIPCGNCLVNRTLLPLMLLIFECWLSRLNNCKRNFQYYSPQKFSLNSRQKFQCYPAAADTPQTNNWWSSRLIVSYTLSNGRRDNQTVATFQHKDREFTHCISHYVKNILQSINWTNVIYSYAVMYGTCMILQLGQRKLKYLQETADCYTLLQFLLSCPFRVRGLHNPMSSISTNYNWLINNSRG